MNLHQPLAEQATVAEPQSDHNSFCVHWKRELDAAYVDGGATWQMEDSGPYDPGYPTSRFEKGGGMVYRLPFIARNV